MEVAPGRVVTVETDEHRVFLAANGTNQAVSEMAGMELCHAMILGKRALLRQGRFRAAVKFTDG